MLQQVFLVKSLSSRASVRSDPFIFTEDAVNHFRIGVGQLEDSGRLVAGQAELSDQDEDLEAHFIIDVDLRLARLPYLPWRHPEYARVQLMH